MNLTVFSDLFSPKPGLHLGDF